MGMSGSAPGSVSRSTEVAAPPERVWALVSDLPRMGELSPENTGGRWLGGATGPVPGARFRGKNRRGARRWSTSVRVTRCEPPRSFAFDVTSGGLGVATWAYEVEPTAGGCRVTETWTDRRGPLMRAIGAAVSGVKDREEFSASSIEQTLDRVKAAAERG